jgi:hypothetical protein
MKDVSDFVEHEIKARPKGSYRRFVELAQASAPPGWRMVRKPHVAFFDMYFDTPDFTLTKTGNHLRIRFGGRSFRGKGRYKLFFKERNNPAPGATWLSRREVRTDLEREELLRYSSGRMPGIAAQLAYESIARAGGSPPLAPVCVISTFRRYFTMRSPDPTETDWLNMGVEQSSAMAISGIDVNLLLESGFIDGPNPGEAFDFELVEAELTVENVPGANAMFERLASSIAAEFEIVTTAKYELCLEALGIKIPSQV